MTSYGQMIDLTHFFLSLIHLPCRFSQSLRRVDGSDHCHSASWTLDLYVLRCTVSERVANRVPPDCDLTTIKLEL